jgi:hypothetical protein
MKVCNKCKIEKEPSAFTFQRGKLRTTCKECRKIESKQWYENNKEKKRQMSYAYRHIKKDQDLRKGYGISLEEFNTKLAEQDHSCKICGTHQQTLKRSLCVDHCHKTGTIRGLLCDLCNRSLGLLKDNKEILKKAVAYLEQYEQPLVTTNQITMKTLSLNDIKEEEELL